MSGKISRLKVAFLFAITRKIHAARQSTACEVPLQTRLQINKESTPSRVPAGSAVSCFVLGLKCNLPLPLNLTRLLFQSSLVILKILTWQPCKHSRHMRTSKLRHRREVVEVCHTQLFSL